MARVRLKRRQTNTLINAKLHPERDEDLSVWWSSQPVGEGSATLKTALREYIAKGTEAAPATQGDLAALRGQLETLVRLVAHLTQKIERGVVVQGAAHPQQTDEARLSNSEAEQRAKRIKERKW